MTAELFFGFAAMVIGVLAVSLTTGTFVRNMRRRASDLDHADRALRAHYEALYQVLDCPDVSERIKSGVYAFHMSVIQREAASEVAASLAGTSVAPTDGVEPDDEFDAEFYGLQAKNPHVFDAMHTVFQSGIAQLLLRWPETAKQFRGLSVEAAIDAEKERKIRRDLIQRSRDHGDHTLGGGLVAA